MSASSPLVPFSPTLGPAAAHGPSAGPDSTAWNAAQQAAMGASGGVLNASAWPAPSVDTPPGQPGPAPPVPGAPTKAADAQAARASSGAQAGVDTIAGERSGIAGAVSALPPKAVVAASLSAVAAANPQRPDPQIADPGDRPAPSTPRATRLPDRHGASDGDAPTRRDPDPSSHAVASTPDTLPENRPSPARTPDEHGTHDNASSAARASREAHPTDDRSTQSDDVAAASVSDHGKGRTAPAVKSAPTTDAGTAGQVTAGAVAGADAILSASRPSKPAQGGDVRIAPSTDGLSSAPVVALLARLTGGDTRRIATSAAPAPASGTTALAPPGRTGPSVVTPPPVQPDFDQPSIIHAATTLIGQGGGVAQVTIHPETLGPVTVQVAMTTTGAVHVLIQAATAAGYAAVNGSLAGMNTHLSQSGVAVATLRAENGGMASGQSGGHSQPQQSGAGPSPAVRPLPAATSDAADRDDGVMAYA